MEKTEEKAEGTEEKSSSSAPTISQSKSVFQEKESEAVDEKDPSSLLKKISPKKVLSSKLAIKKIRKSSSRKGSNDQEMEKINKNEYKEFREWKKNMELLKQ
jgi:hypothetical protein